jgi:hypothetical protein
MRNRFFLALTLLISALWATAHGLGAQTTEWTKETSAEGRFAVLLPTRPLSDEQMKDTPKGRVSMRFLTARSGTGIFIVAYADYEMGDAKLELDANRTSFLKGMKATLVTESDINLRGNPGRDIKAVRDQLSIRSRIYLVGKRYYQMVAITPASIPGDLEADKFLTSFELSTAQVAADRK